MRQTIVLVLLVCMLGGFGALVASRPRTTHQTPAPNQSAALPSASAQASPSAMASTASSTAPNPNPASSGSAAPNPPSVSPSASAPGPDAGPAPALDRPLAVVGLGWDVIAPGILANEGTSPNPKSAFASSGLEVRLSVSTAMNNVENALARGGKDTSGADVAVVPLANFVEAYERLRALTPEVFFVVGFSRGHEALAGKTASLPSGNMKPPVKLVGNRGAPATFLGLFMLDIAGVPGSDLEMVGPGEREEKDAAFFAFDRGNGQTEPGQKIILTSADAPHLCPVVAIAPHGLIAEKERALTALTKGWLEGIKKLGSDPPGGARVISALEGAPEPLALLRRLGEMETATLGDNARFLGLSGRSALTVPSLFQKTWQLYRGVSFVSTPPPDSPAVSTSIVTNLARASESLSPRPATKTEFKEGKDSIVVYRQEKLDEEALINTVGLLAAVFERSVLRVSISGGAGTVDTAKTKKLIDTAEGQFGVESGRLVVASKTKSKGATIEVMTLP